MGHDQPRIPPLSPEAFTPEQDALVGDWRHLNFSRVVVRHPEMYRAFLPFIEQTITRTKLPPRDRQVVILRLLAQADEVYELEHHRTISRRAGMAEAEIVAAESGEGLAGFDRVLADAAEQLLRSQAIDDATWAALSERYEEVQLMDLVFLGGCYAAMAMITKSFGVPLEPGGEDMAAINALRDYT